MPKEIRVGSHVLRIDGDLFAPELQGDFGASDMSAVLDVLERIGTEHGHVLVLVLVTQLRSISPDARRQYAEWSQHHGFPIVRAFVGGSLLTRASIRLVLGAIRLFGSQSSILSAEFFSSESDARAWLDQERIKLLTRSEKS